MPLLAERLRLFQQRQHQEHKELYQHLKSGQKPSVLFITCSDSRIIPNFLTQSEPGEFFVLRNAGNIIPAYNGQTTSSGEAAAIEFALSLGIKEIIVCGHSHCGAVNGLLNPDSVRPLPQVAQWLHHADTTRQTMHENYGHLHDEEQRLNKAIELNVVNQISNLKTHPCIAAKLEKGELEIHGWVYQFETGQVFEFDEGTRKFKEFSVSQTPMPQSKL